MVAQYSALLLVNPAASGKNLVLSQIEFGNKAAGGIYLASYATPLTNDLSATKILNKLLGGPAGVGKFYSGANVAILGNTFNYVPILANSPRLLRFGAPVVMQQGTGILVQGDQLNAEVDATYEWYEDAP